MKSESHASAYPVQWEENSPGNFISSTYLRCSGRMRSKSSSIQLRIYAKKKKTLKNFFFPFRGRNLGFLQREIIPLERRNERRNEWMNEWFVHVKPECYLRWHDHRRIRQRSSHKICRRIRYNVNVNYNRGVSDKSLMTIFVKNLSCRKANVMAYNFLILNYS